MTRWHELPDNERGTGRTTRMLQSVARYLSENPERSAVVVVASDVHGTALRRELIELGADIKRVDIETVGNLKPGRRLTTKYFWDHYAVDEWERWHIAQVTERADELRKDAQDER